MAETFFRDAVRDMTPGSDIETEIVVEISVSSWGAPAQTYGPAESCHDGDPMECEIVDAWLKADEDKADAPRITLTDAERERIETDFLENPPEADDRDDCDGWG